MSIEDQIRAIVRDELARLLAEGERRPDAQSRPLTDVDRARARKALLRAGVALPTRREEPPR